MAANISSIDDGTYKFTIGIKKGGGSGEELPPFWLTTEGNADVSSHHLSMIGADGLVVPCGKKFLRSIGGADRVENLNVTFHKHAVIIQRDR